MAYIFMAEIHGGNPNSLLNLRVDGWMVGKSNGRIPNPNLEDLIPPDPFMAIHLAKSFIILNTGVGKLGK